MRLLIDFLEHVVIEITFVRSFHRLGDTRARTLHSGAVPIEDLYAGGRNLHQITFLQINETIRDLAQGHLVRCEKVLADTNAHHQRAALARTYNLRGV